MQNKVNLEIKYHCHNFLPIRKVLAEIGAKKVGIFSQKDYFFNLPSANLKVPKRLKLRIEGDKSTLIYYERGNFENDKNTRADIVIFDIRDKKLLDFLRKALGVKAVVSKRRELWKKGNFVFNLDTVETVGRIFEIEMVTGGKEEERKFNEYKKKFLPYLGKIVKTSNLDLTSKKWNRGK